MLKGDRVGIIATAIHGKCEFLGWGAFLEMTPFENRTTQKFLLDTTGEVVYGFEFWWGNEGDVKRILKNYDEIVEVSLQDARAKRNSF